VFGKPSDLIEPVYLDSAAMSEFDTLASFDCRLIKLINHNRPAVRIHYYTKHKYFLNKKPSPEEVEEVLSKQLDLLLHEIEHCQEEEKAELIKTAKQYKRWIKNVHQLEFATSNYYNGYRYDYIAYNYLSPKGVETATTHLIKHTTDHEGEVQIHKMNIIFVDTAHISTHISNDNKQVTKYLETFRKQIQLPKYTLYIK